MSTSAVFTDQVQSISDQLCRRGSAWHLNTVWLALDGSERELPAIDGIDWATRAHESVTLAHPDIDPLWWPRWYALRLDRAEDVWILQHSVAWALDERQPDKLSQGDGRRVTGWMWLPTDLARETANAWGKASIQRHGKRTTLLRLHDPAVVWSLWRLLTNTQKAAFLGPVLAIDTLDPLGTLDSLQTQAHQPNASKPPMSLVLAEDQWQDVLHLSALHPVLLNGLCVAPPMDRRTYIARFDVGLQALRRAQAMGFDDPHSLKTFADLAVRRHPTFEQHPLVASLLAHREPGLPLGGVLAELSEADWETIGQSAKAVSLA